MKALSGLTTIRASCQRKRFVSSACAFLLAVCHGSLEIMLPHTSTRTHFSDDTCLRSPMMRCFAAAGDGLSGDMVDDFCLWRGEEGVAVEVSRTAKRIDCRKEFREQR